jgi:hypothetical protein
MTERPNPAPPPSKPGGWQRVSQWVVGIALLITGALGIMWTFNTYLFLPACDSDTASATLKSIFKSKDVELTKVSDFKSVTDTSSEKTCQAAIETSDEKATIDYRIFWDGWTATVMITDVQTK